MADEKPGSRKQDDRGKVVRIVSKWKLKQIMEDYILLPVMILILPIAFFMHWLAFGY